METLKLWLVLAGILLLYGVVGEMDRQDAEDMVNLRAAATYVVWEQAKWNQE